MVFRSLNKLTASSLFSFRRSTVVASLTKHLSLQQLLHQEKKILRCQGRRAEEGCQRSTYRLRASGGCSAGGGARGGSFRVSLRSSFYFQTRSANRPIFSSSATRDHPSRSQSSSSYTNFAPWANLKPKAALVLGKCHNCDAGQAVSFSRINGKGDKQFCGGCYMACPSTFLLATALDVVHSSVSVLTSLFVSSSLNRVHGEQEGRRNGR